MTSASAHPAVVDLSPEQRQALFDKLRQRKLAQARQPSPPATLTPARQWSRSPLQAACPLPKHNRLLSIDLTGTVDISMLAARFEQLMQHHDGLRVRLPDNGGIEPVEQIPPLQQHVDLHAEPLQALATTLTQLVHDGPSLQAAAVTLASGQTRLLLAAHPLLLDHGSLLVFAGQWLALASGQCTLEQIPATTRDNLQRFNQWSGQVLNHRFLNQEWQRLRPLDTAPAVNPEWQTPPTALHHRLDQNFIDTHLQAGQSRKTWLLTALQSCLNPVSPSTRTLYWLAAPTLRDSRFDSQLGFFPHCLPITLAANDAAASASAALPLQRLHNRFTPVSEQLALHVCQQGSQAPLVHYHWFDLADAVIGVSALSVKHPGQMHSPLEIHLFEQRDHINLELHFQPDVLRTGQVQALLASLLQQLRQPGLPNAAPPTLQDRLRLIWAELLHNDGIRDDDSFFELGGHSLQVTELKFRLRQHLKLDIPVAVLYELTTINQLANFIIATHGNSLGLGAELATAEEEEGTL